MRQGSNFRRGRGRGGGGGNGRKPSSRNQSYDSNGPSVRIRGNAAQVLEKYLALARDAATSGDPVTAEDFYQHAEHYYRIMNANAEAADRRGQSSGPSRRPAEQPANHPPAKSQASGNARPAPVSEPAAMAQAVEAADAAEAGEAGEAEVITKKIEPAAEPAETDGDDPGAETKPADTEPTAA